MIKQVRLSDVQSTPFVVTREWSTSNTLNDSLILLSQTGSGGGELTIAWNRIIYGDGTGPYTSSVGSIALSQQGSDDIIYQEGLSGSGLFNPDDEPKNINGTYKRLVYTTINNLFYNRSIHSLGLENISLQKDLIRKFVGNKIRSFMIPQNKFGEKVLENSVKLTDNSLDNEYEISDDGFNNLYAYSNLFSRAQKLSSPGHFLTGSYWGYCDSYVNPVGPDITENWWVDSYDHYTLNSDIESDTWDSGSEIKDTNVYFDGQWNGSQNYIPQWYGLEYFLLYTTDESISGSSEGYYWSTDWNSLENHLPSWYGLEYFHSYTTSSNIDNLSKGYLWSSAWTSSVNYVPDWYGQENFDSYNSGSGLSGSNGGLYFSSAWNTGSNI